MRCNPSHEGVSSSFLSSIIFEICLCFESPTAFSFTFQFCSSSTHSPPVLNHHQLKHLPTHFLYHQLRMTSSHGQLFQPHLLPQAWWWLVLLWLLPVLNPSQHFGSQELHQEPVKKSNQLQLRCFDALFHSYYESSQLLVAVELLASHFVTVVHVHRPHPIVSHSRQSRFRYLLAQAHPHCESSLSLALGLAFQFLMGKSNLRHLIFRRHFFAICDHCHGYDQFHYLYIPCLPLCVYDR